jgi:hypothetical protein
MKLLFLYAFSGLCALLIMIGCSKNEVKTTEPPPFAGAFADDFNRTDLAGNWHIYKKDPDDAIGLQNDHLVFSIRS